MADVSAVSLRGVGKRFGGLTALRDVSLTVPQGAFFGLLGPNGAGKTTLIGMLAGLVRADRGEVSVLGRDVVAQSLAVRADIGIVPQELIYDPFLTVLEALTFQSKYYGLGANRAWIDELLQHLRLSEKAHENTRKLSGGMKRRLMIAQALVHRPPVIVLDEPTAGVDINLRLVLWDFIRRLNADGHTVILTTHYLEEAEVLCDELALMDRGAIVSRGKTRALLSSVQTEVRVRPRDAARAPPPDAPLLRKDGDVWCFCAASPGEVETLLAALRRAGVEFAEVSVSPPRLEDVFLRLIKAG